MAHEELKMQWRLDEERYGKDAYKYWEFDFGYGWQPCYPEGPMWGKANEYRRKEPSFEPEYFSGLNWRDAEKLVGKVVEFSDDPGSNEWESGVLQCLDFRGGCRFKVKDNYHHEYIRTTPETYAHPTITLTVNGREWVLPKPETEAPENGTRYWYMSNKKRRIENYYWVNDAIDLEMLKNGNVHLTHSHAQAWADFWWEAILGAVSG